MTGNSLNLRSAMIATASTIVAPCGIVDGREVMTSQIGRSSRGVAVRFEQPRKIAVGEKPRQLAFGVDEHDGAGPPSRATVLDEHFAHAS